MVIAHIARLKVKLLLTDEAMAEVQGDKDRCLAVIHGFGGCGGCSANCGKVAKAQFKKVVEWLLDNELHPERDGLELSGKSFLSLLDEIK
ncbi:hypothetical protein LCGC14_2017230 [marine sediment metagenome]|uniref:Uncharacterized protein n=1 Tax=marine sediment metagenome TaxID=412755 RepID=A0A0F9EYL9_9ZZZZ